MNRSWAAVVSKHSGNPLLHQKPPAKSKTWTAGSCLSLRCNGTRSSYAPVCVSTDAQVSVLGAESHAMTRASSKGTKRHAPKQKGAKGAPATNALPDEAHAVGAETAPIELVFGFVGPTGIDLHSVFEVLKVQLRAVDYKVFDISLSDAILGISNKSSDSLNAFERIDTLIKDGNALCKKSGEGDIVGRLGLAAIRTIRRELTGSPNVPSATERVAYIVRSFKREEEVVLFRNIYGKAFTLISIYSSHSSRLHTLTKRFQGCIPPKDNQNKASTAAELAIGLIDRDYQEDDEEFGQRVGKTFPMADCFVTNEPRRQLEHELRRIVRLTLGDPYISPTRDEQGMFLAQAAALRSLDLSRQVGAAIISQDGDVLATGCNDVPKFGGGLYWGEDENCMRDFELGEDANVSVKVELVEDALGILRKANMLSDQAGGMSDKLLAQNLLFGKKAVLRNAKLYDVIEYGRAVHAEMSAVSQAARIGVSIRGARLFCTTFPCHICARHLVASGISEVLFIEPYEKSRTKDLYRDSISVEPHEPSTSRANFRLFVGVAPRRYFDLFQMTSDRKTSSGKVIDLTVSGLKPKFKRFVFTYINVEQQFVNELESLLVRVKEAQ
jgi:deoxycytidylate deaminase